MKFVRFKKLIAGAAAFCVIGIFGAAWYFDQSPFFVGKIAVRALALKMIEIGVAVYDPSLPATHPSLTPTVNSENGNTVWVQGRDELALLLKEVLPNKKVSVVEYDNPEPVRSPVNFGYQSSLAPELIAIRDKYGLSALRNQNDDDFSTLVALANWVHKQWQHGVSGAAFFDPGAFNADMILSRARQGDRFWCHVYAMTFIQLATSLGYQARLVSLTETGYISPDMHAVAEIWSDHYRKWVVVDPDFNIWYTRNDVPLNALEIHDAMMTGATNAITIVKGEARAPEDFESRIPGLYKYYRYFYVDMRNDWLSNTYFKGHPARSDGSTLFWNDDRLPPVLNLYAQISDRSVLYWDVNWTCLSFARPKAGGGGGLQVRCGTLTPNFSYFAVRRDDGTETRVGTDKFSWKLGGGVNRLVVRSVNSAGDVGVEATVAVIIGPGE